MNSVTQKKIEELREELGSAIPVSVVAMAKKLGINIYKSEDFDEDESGVIVKENGGYSIYVNSNHPITRTRFTIAHEIAHFLEDREVLDAGGEHVTSIDQPVVLKRSGGVTDGEEQKREQKANQIAAEILMPKESFTKVWQESDTVEEVAKRFGVSTSAAAIRGSVLLGCTKI